MKPYLSAILVLCAAMTATASRHSITVTDDIPETAIPLIGNGHLGMIPSLDGLGTQRAYSITVHERGNAKSVSKIRPVTSPFSLKIAPQSAASTLKPVSRTIDMLHGAYTTVLQSPEITVTSTVRALRGLPYATMCEISVDARRDIDISFVNGSAIAAKEPILYTSRKIKAGKTINHIGRRELRYNEGDDAVVTSSVALCAPGSHATSADSVSVRLSSGQRTSFAIVSVTCSTADCSDPWQESERQALFAASEGRDRLVKRHEALWNELWESDIIIEGNEELQKAATTALYHLYSSIRPDSRRSIAPCGQSGQGYNGHIFWDADTWMLPVMAALQPSLAKSMVDFRTDGIPAAKRRAQGMGYKGAMFPWEADNYGEESTPTFALTGTLEQHITACVANGAWQYYCVSGDRDWLRSDGYPLMKECAEFWLSRAEPNDDGSFSINNVIGADEYMIGIDDNAFTNGAVKASLLNTIEAAKILGNTPDPRWRSIAEGLRFNYFPDGVMREHATYDGGQIKQSDVTLLGYPLGLINDRDELIRNIQYYDTKLDPDHGPAMSHGIMAVTLARTGRAADAAQTLERAYKPFVRGPFMVLAETAKNNRTYFLTGAGSLLQGIIFGYAGIDITPQGLRQVDSVLPRDIKSVSVKTPAGTFIRRHQ